MVSVNIKVTDCNDTTLAYGNKVFDTKEEADKYISAFSAKCAENNYGFECKYESYVNPIARDMFPKWFIEQWQNAHA